MTLSAAALTRLRDQVERSIYRDLVAILDRVRAGLPLRDIERALLERNIDAAIEAIGLEPVVNALYAAQSATAEIRAASWRASLALLPRPIQDAPDAQLSLDAAPGANRFALQAIQRQSLARIDGVRDQTVGAIRDTLAAGLAAGTPPATLARQLRVVIGLNRPQVAALDKFRSALETRGDAPEDVDRRVARRSRQLLTQRAQNIATNEVMTALNEGARLQRERLVQTGTIQADQWEQEWVTADDERTCPVCEPLHGERFPVGGTIQTDAGPLAGPPAHVRCRCITRLVLRGFRAGETPAPARRAIR